MRALLIILDSVGIGGAPDAAAYGDYGADTLGHLLDRFPSLALPTVWSLGLGNIICRNPVARPSASWGKMREVSSGKDSTTGHWELAGAILKEPFGVFAKFPAELVAAIESEAAVTFLGNIPASGTQIIESLGPEHLRTRRPILYTSADSVLQIAAHEEIIPIERLYEICRVARRHADAYRIGRVIARPFVGTPGAFRRTARRHDFSMVPPPTVLNAIMEADFEVNAIGKIVDLFAGEGITRSFPTDSNADGMRQIESVWKVTSRGLVFANLVDFDTLYGHRRDPAGYAAALEAFDRWLSGFLSSCTRDDLLIITADHGNDPTFTGTDHTRERVPLLVKHGRRAVDLGERRTFADVAASLAHFFALPRPWPIGTSFIVSQDARCKSGQRHDHVSTNPSRSPRAGERGDRGALGRGSPQPHGHRASREDGAARRKPAGEGDLLQPHDANAADRAAPRRAPRSGHPDQRRPQ